MCQNTIIKLCFEPNSNQEVTDRNSRRLDLAPEQLFTMKKTLVDEGKIYKT